MTHPTVLNKIKNKQTKERSLPRTKEKKKRMTMKTEEEKWLSTDVY